MHKGEGSGSVKTEHSIWAKLVPTDSSYPVVELTSNAVVICSQVSSQSPDRRIWCKITRKGDADCAKLENKGPSTILVDALRVEVENSAIISRGSEIIAGPDRNGWLGYKFHVIPMVEPSSTSSKRIKIPFNADHAKCSICLNIWHDVVTVAPCLHNFCNGCFSEWLRTCKQKHDSVRCPQCREEVQFVGRNHFLQNIEQEIFRVDSSLQRSKEDIALLDSRASIRSPLVIDGQQSCRKRGRDDSAADESDQDTSCPQCGSLVGGFQCNASTTHLQCHECEVMMPSRTDITVPQHYYILLYLKYYIYCSQHCLGCDRAFCAAYWHTYDLVGSVDQPVCSIESFKPISEHRLERIPSTAHESNIYEQEITKKCISQMGLSLQDVISQWITKLNNREIDRVMMPLHHAETITSQTHVCRFCYENLVSFLLYWFRITLPRHLLPQEASQREDCWFGYACRTQHHKPNHAQKRNHVCRPTRGNR
ncbi:hypothetical protein Leryth_006470 [Lithospermum erythrorhizon]|nr:hypothetical protein Leryth_006470 [Lithospermum erythrorhizon]